LIVLKELEKGRQIGWVILTISIHHCREGTCGGENTGIKGRALAEIFWEMDDADIFFLIEKGRGTVFASVVHRDDFNTRQSGPSFRNYCGDVFLLVIKRDDEGKLGGHDLFGMEQRRESGKQFRKPSFANFFPYGICDLGNRPSVEHGKRDRGENVGWVVVARVNTT
jgi:hypothetical protein